MPRAWRNVRTTSGRTGKPTARFAYYPASLAAFGLAAISASTAARAQVCTPPINPLETTCTNTTTLTTTTFANGGLGGMGNGGAGSPLPGANGNAGTFQTLGEFSSSAYFGNGGDGGSGSGGLGGSGIGGEGGFGSFDSSGTLTNSGTFGNGGNGGAGMSGTGGTGIGGAGGDGNFNASGTIINTGSFGNGGNGGAGGSGPLIIGASSAFTNANNGTFDNRGTTENSGTFTNDGSITGNGDFINLPGGTFNTGGAMSFGNFSNSGSVVVNGGVGPISPQAMTGNFAQTQTGALNVRTDWNGDGGTGDSDTLQIAGNTSLDGTVVITPVGFADGMTNAQTFNILSATGGITDNGISVADTASVNYTLLFPDAHSMQVTATVDFQGIGTHGLNSNQIAVSGSLNAIFDNGTMLPFMTALMQLPTGTQLAGALDQLAPLGDAAGYASTMKAAATFADHLLSCRVAGDGDVNAVIREGQCLWARAHARRTEAEASNVGAGWRETAELLSVGGQIDVGGPWRLGGGIGYETPSLRFDTLGRSESERLHLGGTIKYSSGPWLLAATLSGGFGATDTARVIDFGGFASQARSDAETRYAAGRLTAAYLMTFAAAYLKPQMTVGHTWLHRDGYHETGTGGTPLDVRSAGANVWTFTPSLEFCTEYRLSGTGLARPYVKAGATIRDRDTFAMTASFSDPSAAAPFETISTIDSVMAEFGIGIDFIGPGDRTFRVQYDGTASEHMTEHSGSVKFSIPF